MKVGILQYKPEFGEVEANLDRIGSLLSDIDTDIILLPELFATGYVFENGDELRYYAEPFPDGRTHKALKVLSEKIDSAIFGSFPEINGDNIYNTALFVRPDGKTRIYRKIHLFDREKLFFTPGNLPFEVFEFRGARVGMMICFDWIFPESYRTLALKGADIILHCSNLVLPFCQKATYAHAVSNRVFIAMANRIGTENRAGVECVFTGGSIMYSPTGDVLIEMGEDEENVRVAEISPSDARNKFATERNHVFSDRRTEFYELD
ncbi:hypothetical protein DRQ36_11310 [bacterium]|nr:MAG: hypothetical protein DRQ36_11310 [bacterium]